MHNSKQAFSKKSVLHCGPRDMEAWNRRQNLGGKAGGNHICITHPWTQAVRYWRPGLGAGGMRVAWRRLMARGERWGEGKGTYIILTTTNLFFKSQFFTNLPTAKDKTINSRLVIRINMRNMTYLLPPDQRRRAGSFRRDYFMGGAAVYSQMKIEKHLQERKKWLSIFSKY